MNVYGSPVSCADLTPEAITTIGREHLVGARPVKRHRFREQPLAIRTPGRRH